uniref:TFIIE beta domain-containing protein n=1 Tax=Polytomella parva TaxID=51329 RepID=A0A7S0VDT5_9CHLO|mmetsp:Transcript_33750/g.60936  ORF Transcript_33750/g.60936 Transcript_33750/m.60936 type:complete len:299 (+) Transcript_33750:202-1098(+)|eukprot:CAMPEP_0175063412 /NCGR_PEP_ID=MMETSP0052_2-20121109/14743_1 /TAXON_ID=51329 ORGANISM="Polytomella parva, Strain SAG 63-3" /NCGR_SAMPLE_ID=MMETSP0052_2 /ASSEMBLY_ACC=CAM_ASM_000194 /LENGTH=298 /DNA_ID=CAMNT_0016329609 /DNA_START=167 /DNA_END=1063 /DNA_ORIENTATION=-
MADSNVKHLAVGHPGELPYSSSASRLVSSTENPSSQVKRIRLGGAFSGAPISSRPVYSSSNLASSTTVVRLSDEPLASRLKHVLDALRRIRVPFTRRELTTSAGLAVDVEDDKELYETLLVHERVKYDKLNGTYSYVPNIRGVNNRQQLMQYLNANTTSEGVGSMGMVGVRFADIEDAYLAIKDDVERLRDEGKIYAIGNLAAQDAALFAYCPLKINGVEVAPVDPDVLALFGAIEVPKDMHDLQRACTDVGLKSWLKDRPPPPPMPEKEAKKRAKVRRKINLQTATNAHMPELFENQ